MQRYDGLDDDIRYFQFTNTDNQVEIFESRSLEDTEKFSNIIADKLKTKTVIFLEGNLGSGKTTFVNFLGKKFGVSTRITSPSFTIVKEYETHQNDSGLKKIVHIDVYRLITANLNPNQVLAELLVAGVDFEEDDVIFIIEWGEALTDLIDVESLTIKISTSSGDI